MLENEQEDKVDSLKKEGGDIMSNMDKYKKDHEGKVNYDKILLQGQSEDNEFFKEIKEIRKKDASDYLHEYHMAVAAAMAYEIMDDIYDSCRVPSSDKQIDMESEELKKKLNLFFDDIEKVCKAHNFFMADFETYTLIVDYSNQCMEDMRNHYSYCGKLGEVSFEGPNKK